MRSIKSKHLTVGMVVAALAGLGAAYSFADEIGFKLDRFAWKSELVAANEATADALAELAGMALGDLLLRKERRLWEVNRQLDKYRREGQPAPRHLIDEKSILEREIKRLREKLG